MHTVSRTTSSPNQNLPLSKEEGTWKNAFLNCQLEQCKISLTIIKSKMTIKLELGTIGDTENWADVSFSCQNF
jgi:hypothetical protein